MNLARELLLGLALFLAPTLALASFLRVGGFVRRYGLAAALSPVAFGVAELPLRLAGLSSLQAGAGALAAWALVAVVRLRHLPPRPAREERGLLLLVGLLSLVVLVPPLVNPYLAVRSDAWFHAAVEAQVRNLPLPPQDPYYAGLRLQYFWFFHLVLAGYDSVAHVGPFVAMWLFNGL